MMDFIEEVFYEYLNAAIEEPWLYFGPFVLTIVGIIFLYIAAQRLIDDDSWSVHRRFPIPNDSTKLSFKKETPASSLVLSKTQFIKHHNWRFINHFSPEKFDNEG